MENIFNVVFRLEDGSAMFTQDNDDSFKTMIDVAYKVTSKHLMEVLYTKYNFINHLKVCQAALNIFSTNFVFVYTNIIACILYLYRLLRTSEVKSVLIIKTYSV